MSMNWGAVVDSYSMASQMIRAAGASASTGATAQGESKDSGGGLGDLLGGFLSSPTGKAVLAGTAAFAMKEVLGDKK